MSRRDLLVGTLYVAVPVLVLAAFIFWLKHDTPIWGDGKLVIDERLPPTLKTLLKPFHAHLNAATIALWAILPGTGAKLAALLVAHVALATATTALLIARLGRNVGVALGLPLGLLGSAHFDLLMPWQILFMLPLLLGLVAILAAEPHERTWTLRILVAGSVGLAAMCSNVGLFLGFALGVWFLLERRWTQVLELMPAAIGWGLWFLRFGSKGVRETDFPPTLDAIPYTINGISSGVGGVAGVGPTGGLVIIIAVIAFVIWRRVRIPRPMIAFGVTLIVMFVVLSGFRLMTGVNQALGSRYIYITGYFIAFGLLMGAPRLPQTRWWLVLGVAAAVMNLFLLRNALPGYP